MNKYPHQDWQTVIIGKKKTNNEKQKSNGTVKTHHSKKVFDDEGDVVKNKKVSVNTGIHIAQLRQKMGLNQKELAAKINENESIIKTYENATAIYNGNIINKLNKFFGEKINR